jgi:hypothetical protein
MMYKPADLLLVAMTSNKKIENTTERNFTIFNDVVALLAFLPGRGDRGEKTSDPAIRK